ncbi:MAG TPA: hypothetical protein V6C81_11575 [Planktothrix sp.]|jgi:hypothetical protein
MDVMVEVSPLFLLLGALLGAICMKSAGPFLGALFGASFGLAAWIFSEYVWTIWHVISQ